MQTDGLGSSEADTDGPSESSHLRWPKKSGLMGPE